MRIRIFRHVVCCLILLTAGSYGARPANAQATQPIKSNKAMIASYSTDDLLSVRTGPESTGEPKVDLVQSQAKKEKRKKVRISVTAADPQKGIVGFVEDEDASTRINFQSKRVGEHLFAQITNKEGHTLIEYVEAKQEVVADPEDGTISFEWVPWLRVNGIELNDYQGPVVEEMKAIARSAEGELIRSLALYLVFHAAGEALESERRGLEVTYQAIQKYFAKSYKSGFGALSAEEIIAGGKNAGQRPAEIKPQHDGKHGEVIMFPSGCTMPDCVYVDTQDYQLTEQGGFVLKSLSSRLVLTHNYARPETIHSHNNGLVSQAKSPANNSAECRSNGSSLDDVKAMDDGSQVGDCYGRCGGGCGNWTHTWVVGPVQLWDYTYCTQPDPDNFMWDCRYLCCSRERRVTTYSGIAIHTASGRVTLGSKAHDSCCRNSFLGCWNPACIAIAPLAADCFIPGVGEEHTWSYVGGHMEGYDYDTGACCDSPSSWQ